MISNYLKISHVKYRLPQISCIVLRQFSVSAFESAKIRCLDQLAKGKVVKVSGRVRVQRYTDDNGAERSCWEIIAHEVEVKEDRV